MADESPVTLRERDVAVPQALSSTAARSHWPLSETTGLPCYAPISITPLFACASRDGPRGSDICAISAKDG